MATKGTVDSLASLSERAHPSGSIGLKETIIGLLLTCTSGAAILAHTFGPLPMSFTVPFVVMPSAAVVIATILLRRGLHERLRVVSSLLLLGGWTGLVATFVYDAVRPLIRALFGFSFKPYEAMPIFGQLMTGLPPSAPLAIASGWIYHFWNGISFGMMFALFRPQGGPMLGLAWGLGLQVLMFVTYPNLLHAKLNDPGFVVIGLGGHALWGIVLGALIKRVAPRA